MTAADPSLPVDTFKDAATFLRRPFTPAAVKFKPQSVTKTGKTLVVAYIDARLVVERFNLVCPHLWHDAYEATNGGLMWCHLTVDGITRSDVGQGIGKALVSDALKRAAVRFGVGVSLYAVPQQWLPQKVEYLSDQQNAQLRTAYDKWLKSVGIKAFGEPFDHGDVEGSQGDDADPATADSLADPPDVPLTDEQQLKVRTAMDDAGLTADQKQKLLIAAGVDSIDKLTVATAYRLRDLVDEQLAKNGATA